MGLARCAINPETMQSKKYHIEPAKKAKKIAVIGGGIAGMETALVAAKRGHSVTLYEKSGELGGVFIAAAAPDFKEKDKELIAWYRREMQKYPIAIRLNTPVTDLSAIEADEIVVATGATARRIPVAGADTAVEAIDYLLGNKQVGDKVVVIGGGLTGCEIAYDLYRKGKTPIIVEMQDDLMHGSGVPLANTSYLRDFFKTNQVETHLETRLNAITEVGVTVTHKDGTTEEIAADSVILSVGYVPAPVAKKGVHIVGDADKVGNLRSVIWGAWDVCMKL